MKTFLTVKLSLLPLALFWGLLARGWPLEAVLAGGAASVLVLAFTGRRPRWLDLAVLALLAALGAGLALAPGFTAAHALALSFAGLGAYALASVAAGRPWTAEFSRGSYAAQAETTVFKAVNAALSVLWGVLFLGLAACDAAQAPGWLRWGLVGFGALVSVAGPKLLLRLVLRRMRRGEERFHWAPPDFGGTEYDVAVVGAGIGGLSAAALLAQAGLRVFVAEAHVVPGGYCHTFLRKAWDGDRPLLFRFDAGPHDFSGVWEGGTVHGLLKRLGVGGRLRWRRVTHALGAGAAPTDWRDYAAELGRRFPASAAGILAVFADMNAVLEAMYSFAPARGGIPGGPVDLEGMLEFPRRHPLAMRWMNRPFAEFMARHVTDPEAQRALLALSGYLTDQPGELSVADVAPLFGYVIKGGFYPLGGSGRLAEVLAEAVTERGGTLALKARVARILVERGAAAGLELADGRRVAARAVVCNGDWRRAVAELLPPDAFSARYRTAALAAEPAPSAFAVHLGVRGTLAGPMAASTEADGLRVAVVTPSAVDPEAAPEGYATVQLFTLLPHAEARAWFGDDGSDDQHRVLRRSADYEARKQALADRMITVAEQVLPGLRQHILHRSEASPITYARYDLASSGAIYGVARSQRHQGVKTPVRGLVIAGGAHSGSGVEAALISGAWAAEALRPGLLAAAPAPLPERVLTPA